MRRGDGRRVPSHAVCYRGISMAPSPSTSVGRYTIGGQLASGGMATVHVGAVKGAAGFSRLVALKRMLPSFASDPDFTLMFVDEARLAARIRHPNVVPTLDVVSDGSELSIVMDYVPGVTLAQIARLLAPAGGRVPVPIALAIVRDVLLGLHAAHEATDDDGRPLGIIHRDVSPQNILVGTDGAARLLDFGIAKANVRLHETRAGDTLKGKLRYMAPEQLEGAPAERRTDVFAAAVVLWEALTGERLVDGQHEGEIVAKVLRATPRPPSTVAPGLAPEVDVLVLRALSRTPDERFSNARDMAAAISLLGPVATALEVGEWVEGVAAGALAERAELVRLFERGSLGEQRLSVAFDPTRTAIPATDPLPGVANPPAPRSRRRQVSKALGLVAVAILGAVIVLGARTRVPAPAPAGASSSSSSAITSEVEEPSPRASPAVAEPTPAYEQQPRPAVPAATLRSGTRSSPARAGRRAPQALPDHL